MDLALRARFNPALEKPWFGGLMEIINNVTLLSIILTGAALIREREHGTIEHLLVMPVTPTEIMLAKVWSMGAVVLLAAALSLGFVVRGLLHVPVEGSVALFLVGAALHLFATTSMGIFLATLARSMPQLGLLLILTLIFGGALAGVGAAFQLQRQHDVFQCVQAVEQLERLEHEAHMLGTHAGALVLVEVFQRVAGQDDFAVAGTIQSREQAEQGGFAGA